LRSSIPARNSSRVNSVREVTLTWIIASCRSSGSSATAPRIPNPALLTTTSMVVPVRESSS
jgi:hypothetical protein